MLNQIKKGFRYVAVFSCCVLGFLTIVATGGGGGGGGATSTQPSITPLIETDDSTHTGTYDVTSFDYYFSTGEHLSSSDLDWFDWQLTIDIPNDWTTYKVEWRDDELGDYYDYGEAPLSYVDPSLTFDAAYYEITGDYTVVFYFDNLCSEDICADIVLRLKKISDEVALLLQKTTESTVLNAFEGGGIVSGSIRNLKLWQ
jgi:hypothetical protein